MTINTFITFADTSGDVQALNAGHSDNTNPIYYELETQEIDFGNKAHFKKISDKIGTLNEFDVDSSLQVKADDGDYKNIPINSAKRINIGEDINIEGNFFTFKWFGETSTNSPIFEGLYIEDIKDLGITYK